MGRYLIYFLVFCSLPLFAQSSNTKFNKWLSPGFFKGYNVLYESPKSLQDFIDFRNYGGNLMHIGIDGFMKEDPPYLIQQNNIDGTDLLVNYCRDAGIYYSIAVRSGPGAYDTYDESQGTTGESRIWNKNNTAEQQLYADMLNMIISRYANDSLFVGINLIVEPRPKVRSIPANNSDTYKFFLESFFDIHMDDVYNFLIKEIRLNDAELPIIIENFGYSTPELFPSYELNDPYIVYSAHNYQPKEYTNASPQNTQTYPGTYWNLTYLAKKFFDAAFMRDVVFGKLKEFQKLSGKPVFIGEFGVFYPQNGTNTYINDVLGICKDNGWHFALWDWRGSSGKEWNIENFQDVSATSGGLNSWETVLSYFYAPPVPEIISPLELDLVQVPVVYKWDSLTSYTKYDIEVYNDEGLFFADSNITNASYVNTNVLYLEGKHYYWRIRSKNPGGKAENISQWTELEDIYIPAITDKNSISENKYELYGNYPNPFNPSTVIKYSLPKGSFLTLRVYDLLGREIQTLVNEYREQGEYSTMFNSGNLASGIYIYKLTAVQNNNTVFSEVKKMILLK